MSDRVLEEHLVAERVLERTRTTRTQAHHISSTDRINHLNSTATDPNLNPNPNQTHRSRSIGSYFDDGEDNGDVLCTINLPYTLRRLRVAESTRRNSRPTYPTPPDFDELCYIQRAIRESISDNPYNPLVEIHTRSDQV